MVHKWQPAPGEGWTHGDFPACPPDLKAESEEAWRLWFSGWWAAFYVPSDVPQLELAIITYDRALRREIDVSKVTPLLDKLGLTPKGRQDLRWLPPKGEVEVAGATLPDEIAGRREARAKKLA